MSTLTAGSIGCETVTQSGNPASLSAGPNHRFTVIFAISFANPGPGANQSHFGRLNTNGAAIQMSSDVYALGRVEGETAAGFVMSFTSTGPNRLLSAGGISMNSVLFNNVRLSVGSDIALFGNATFSNQSPTSTQLEIAHPGAATPLTFNNVTFTTVPTTGLYVSATDTNHGRRRAARRQPAKPGASERRDAHDRHRRRHRQLGRSLAQDADDEPGRRPLARGDGLARAAGACGWSTRHAG